ncbi:zf-HC2 domain-containing protein [Hoyosella sp. YIM 151337]|uniref:zf-HC2 domain-containing protein n=1 Tax=Hoyosella sp. YIM 151337 TaxID=2992742 RepID=UPI002236AD5C|nr:zf-HC2 domain-containing protein [Hoyosella sp. YIM 151337]MCW4355864.1 zf-HC2 domain-containing protein [Hoyosella sp. YIM 151337]
MIRMLRMMITCHWSAKRIQHYLDADPAAPLSSEDIQRLEAHLSQCNKCRALAEEHHRLRSLLDVWARRTLPDKGAVQRVQGFLDDLTVRDPGDLEDR